MTTKILTVLTLLCAFAMTAVADDFAPPNWRGAPNTTRGRWEFDIEPGQPTAPPITNGDTWFQDPDDGFFPFGDPVLRVEPGATQSWFPEDTRGGSERIGIWPLSGFLDVVLENSPVEREVKEIWIQLTWLPQNETSFPSVQIVDPGPGPIVTDPLFQEELDFGWVHSVFHLQVRPNPSQETIQIFGAVDVDELVIDTWCVPEPATMVMLGIGGLAVLRRRRKKLA